MNKTNHQLIRSISPAVALLIVASAGWCAPIQGTITFEELLDTDGTMFDTWDIVKDQYALSHGVAFSNGQSGGFTAFHGVLPTYYVPDTAPVIVSSNTGYGRVTFDVNLFGVGLSMVGGVSTVASSLSSSQGGPNPHATLTIRALSLTADVIDQVTISRNYGSNTAWQLFGNGNIAAVEFIFHDQGTSADHNYWWSLDTLRYAGPTQAMPDPTVPEPATLALLAAGVLSLAGSRKSRRR